MPTELPIACTLTAAEMPKRLAEMRAIGLAALVSVDSAESSSTLRFNADGRIRERLEAIVEAESECCAFLDFDLADEDRALVLTIRSPEGAEPVLHELVAAFRGEASPA